MTDRTVFFISDGTGITAETFGNAILAQFEMKARHVRLPFIDSADKAHQTVRQINHTALIDGKKPIVFTTLVNMEILQILQATNAQAVNGVLYPGFLSVDKHRLADRIREFTYLVDSIMNALAFSLTFCVEFLFLAQPFQRSKRREIKQLPPTPAWQLLVHLTGREAPVR